MIHIYTDTATYIVEEFTIPSNVAADILSMALYWRFLHAYTQSWALSIMSWTIHLQHS